MKKFVLIMNDAPEEREIEGEDLNDACQKAGLAKEDLECLDHFIDDNGKVVQVFGRAKCGCVYLGTNKVPRSLSESNAEGVRYAEDGVTCIHDLARVGITYIMQNA